MGYQSATCTDCAHPSTPGAIIVTVYITCYMLCICVYLFGLYRHRANYYLILRIPILMSLNAFFNAFISMFIALRQIFSDLGIIFPCHLSNLALNMALTIFLWTFYYRALKLVILFDPDLRAKWTKLITKRGLQLTSLCQITVGLILWRALITLDLCNSNLCLRPNCFIGAGYFYAASFAAFHSLTLAVLAHKLSTLRIQDTHGIVNELFSIAVTVGVGGFMYSVSLLLLLFNVIHGVVWEHCITGGLLILNALLLWFSELRPAIQHGFSPFSSMNSQISPDYATMPLPTPTLIRHLMSTEGLLPHEEELLSDRYDPSAFEDVRLDLIVNDDGLREKFLQYCRKAICEESFLYIQAVRSLEMEDLLVRDRAAFTQQCEQIGEKYIRPGAPYEVRLSLSHAEGLSKDIRKFGRRRNHFLDEALAILKELKRIGHKLQRELIMHVIPGFELVCPELVTKEENLQLLSSTLPLSATVNELV